MNLGILVDPLTPPNCKFFLTSSLLRWDLGADSGEPEDRETELLGSSVLREQPTYLAFLLAAGPGRESAAAERPPVLQRDREGAAGHGVLLPPGHTPLLLLLPPGVPHSHQRWVTLEKQEQPLQLQL